jgi:RHS repeat-associated protein
MHKWDYAVPNGSYGNYELNMISGSGTMTYTFTATNAYMRLTYYTYGSNTNFKIDNLKITNHKKYVADVVSYSDYSPYGTLLHHRHGTQSGSDSYRYAFQGQEKDDEIKGEGNSYNYTYRMHDPRIGRFFAVDPLTAKYPWYTPYQFSGNKPIQFVELEGLEEDISGANSGGKSPEEMVKYLQSRIEANEAQIQNIEQQQQQQTAAITEQLNGEVSTYTELLERNISTKQELMRMRQGFAEMAYVLYEMNRFFDYAEDPTNNQDANYYVQSFTPYKNLTEIFLSPVSTGIGSSTDPSTMATGSCYPTTFAAPVVDYGKEKLSAGLQYAGMGENAANNTSEGVFFFASIIIARKAPSLPTGKFYSVAYEMKLSDDILTKGYGTHFRAANKSLFAAMTSDATFASQMNEIGVVFKTTTAGKIKWDLSPKNYVWHHDVSPGIMQLVPKVQHTTGSIFWKTLHPNGLGGMAIWGYKAPLRE